jgi:EAL domain-containing protein (putative c-di-GMP-specific phosphodiesterase class I)/GGDEF domain-containing protein
MSGVVNVPPIRRQECLEAFETFISNSRKSFENIGMLLVDISNLSRINRSHGLLAGDRILASTFSELQRLNKSSLSVFRISSHGFVFPLPAVESSVAMLDITRQIVSSLDTVLAVRADELEVDITVGAALNFNSDIDALHMLATAESSLARAKAGEDSFLESASGDESSDAVHYRLEQQFVEALGSHEFELVYQPQIDLRSGEVSGAEALSRWVTREGETVPTHLVVSMARGAGRSYDLTKWVVNEAMRQLQGWEDTLDVNIAVNIPAGLVSNPDLASLLSDASAIWGIQPGKVTVEITESAIIEDKEAGFSNLLAIRDSGFNISIDDFGTGYSSLSYFKHIPATELKIDRVFVAKLMDDRQDLELVKIMLQIAHEFGMSVVAEGVEDKSSVELLAQLGCDMVQGYYFSEPLSADEFETWAHAWPGLPG